MTGLAYLSGSPTVTPQWYLAPIFAFSISIIATMSCGDKLRIAKPVAIALRLVAIILGTSLVAIGVLIIIKFSTVNLLVEGLQPGFFGGVLLLILSVLYLPNAAVAFASYIAGSGFAVGSGTLVSPWWHHIDQLPVFPLLGIIPIDRHPMWIVGGLFFVGLGVLLAYWTLQSGIELLLQSALFLSVMIFLLAYLSSGSLMTDEMGAMGVSVWKFGLTALLEFALGAALTTLVITKRAR